MASVRHLPAGLLALGLGLALTLSGHCARAERIAVVTTSPAGDETVRSLEEQLDVPIERRESSHARDPSALLAEARATWGDDLVVVLDSERATVTVLRPKDGTVSSRTLPAEAAQAPYVVALAAVELLGIVRGTPLVKSRAPHEEPRRRHENEPPPPWLSLDFGLVQSVGTNGDIALLQPTIGLDARIARFPSATWIALGVHGTGLTSTERAQVLVLPSGIDPRGTLDYGRNEVSLRLSLGRRYGLGSAIAFSDAGLAVVKVSARDGSDHEVASSSHATFWLGGGGELRYALVGGLSVGIGAGFAWFPSTSRFHASPPQYQGEIATLTESSVDLRARLTVAWELPL